MSVPLSDTRLTSAEVRLAQYREQSTWSNASYGSGTEKALHEIATGLKEEIDRLRAVVADHQGEVVRYDADHERLSAELAEYKRTVAYFDEQSKRRRTERDEARAQVHAASTVKCWTNEDGRRFVFAEDLAAALGYTPTTPAAPTA